MVTSKGERERKVVVASPSWTDTPEWRALSEHAWIGIERYISGREGKTDCGDGFDVGCLASKYAVTKQRYIDSGVPASRLIQIEHFGHTRPVQWKNGAWQYEEAKGVWKKGDFGRTGLRGSDWKLFVQRRAAASRQVGFAGFISYGWDGNPVGVTEDKRIEHALHYMKQELP